MFVIGRLQKVYKRFLRTSYMKKLFKASLSTPSYSSSIAKYNYSSKCLIESYQVVISISHHPTVRLIIPKFLLQ